MLSFFLGVRLSSLKRDLTERCLEPLVPIADDDPTGVLVSFGGVSRHFNGSAGLCSSKVASLGGFNNGVLRMSFYVQGRLSKM